MLRKHSSTEFKKVLFQGIETNISSRRGLKASIEKQILSHLGKYYSQETKDKMSKAHCGKNIGIGKEDFLLKIIQLYLIINLKNKYSIEIIEFVNYVIKQK